MSGGAGGKDLARPIRPESEEGGVWHLGHRLASPARQVWHQDVGLRSEMKLRLIENDPSARASLASLEGGPELLAQRGGCLRVGRRETRVGRENAVDDLRDHVGGSAKNIFVRGSLDGVGHHEIVARPRRRFSRRLSRGGDAGPTHAVHVHVHVHVLLLVAVRVRVRERAFSSNRTSPQPMGRGGTVGTIGTVGTVTTKNALGRHSCRRPHRCSALSPGPPRLPHGATWQLLFRFVP
jgi:hypothetical protein